VYPSSHCPDCNSKIKYYDLLPVISYLLLKGKCRYCGERISWQYPLVELLTGFLFITFYWRFSFDMKFIVMLLLLSLLIVSSFIDLRYKIIPNKITYIGIISGLVLSIFFTHITMLNSLLGAIIPAGLLLLIALIYKKGMGIGDVKLVAMIGTFIGWEYTLLAIFLASLVGSIIGLTLLVSGVISRKTQIPFGPFITIGTLIIILFGQELINLYISLFI